MEKSNKPNRQSIRRYLIFLILLLYYSCVLLILSILFFGLFSFLSSSFPASSASTISFNLKEENTVKMEVMSVIGTLVYAVNAQTLNAGKHSLPFNTNNLDNGIYFVKLTIGNKTVVQKVSVNK